jgi:hypothetical protein
VKELEDVRLLVDLDQGRRIGMAEGLVRLLDERTEVGPRDLVLGDVEGEDSRREIDEGVRLPVLLPVTREGWDVFRNVKPAIRSEARQDSLNEGVRPALENQTKDTLTSSNDKTLSSPRVEKYFIATRWERKREMSA